ncbi:cytosine permease, partial [Aeromicrobium sp.]|uniref:cytosine permease n=1 Tax=Aeromicrobium sp. TaxID=1871063 RepID=UPI003C6691B4
MSSADISNEPIHRPRATEVEQHGIDTIPTEHRHSGPRDLFRIQFGGANTFATVILGTFPILLGLSLWEAVAATVLGVLVGALILMPMGLFGPLTGTNNAVSSGAHFGVRGRVLGSFLSLLTAIAFYSISVWVSGDALVG